MITLLLDEEEFEESKSANYAVSIAATDPYFLVTKLSLVS
jgi:hypothetical protein